jgi:Protein of unknown function (DUF664)
VPALPAILTSVRWWTSHPAAGRRPADFRLEPHETLSEVLGYYAETAALTEQIVEATADFGLPSASDERVSVRWVILHLIKETARHAGHADIIRENLDGQRAGQLDQAYESGRTS